MNNTKSIGSFANIAQATGALLDHAVATIGTTVYAGDTLQTDPTGSAMMQVRGSQAYLANDSAVKLEDGGPALMRVSLLRGVAGFSSGSNDLVEIDCNEVIVHSRTGVPARGQVALVNPTELLVQSIHGDFDITFGGVTQTIASGKAYRAVISQSTGTTNKNQHTGMTNPHWDLKLAIAVAVTERCSGT